MARHSFVLGLIASISIASSSIAQSIPQLPAITPPLASTNLIAVSQGTSPAVTGKATVAQLIGTATVLADIQPGANMGAKINAAIALLPSTGGVVDARGLTGNQIISTAITVPSNASLLIGASIVTQSGIITLGQNASVVCLPSGFGQGAGSPSEGPSFFKQANTINLTSMFVLGGGVDVLQNCTIDGNKANNPSSGPNVLVTGSHWLIANVTSQNSNSDGYRVSSTGTTDAACCGTFRDVMSVGNAGDGYNSIGTADVIFEGSQSENNLGAAGVELNNSPSWRFSAYDIGGNVIGVWVHGASFNSGVSLGSGNQMIGIGQFGNQSKQDLYIDDSSEGSFNNIISGSQFFPSQFRADNTYASVDILEGAQTSGNVVFGQYLSITGFRSTSAVYIHGTTGRDYVGGLASGLFGTTIYNVPKVDLVGACDATAGSTCYQGYQTLYGPRFVNDTTTGYASSSSTSGANAGDQFASAVNNPSTAAFATVSSDLTAGGLVIGRVEVQRDNLNMGGSLIMQSANTSGALTSAITIDTNQNITVNQLKTGTPSTYACFTSAGQLISSSVVC